MSKLFRQPLLHFLLLGFALYLVFEFTASYQDDESRIILVDRDRLLTHMQFRSRAFDPGRFDTMLAEMDDAQLQSLVDEFVQEEALHREALSLGLDSNDYIIRRRLIQKIEYLSRGFDTEPLDQAALQNYFDENQSNYYIEPTRTFTHVFVNRERHDDAASAAAAAQALLAELTDSQISFSGAMQFGDRFAYHKNYVDRTQSFVASHFGREFASAVFELDADVWQGPVQSAYGWHLVLVSRIAAGRVPEIGEVADQVLYDAEQAALKQRTEEAIQEVIDSYKVVVDVR